MSRELLVMEYIRVMTYSVISSVEERGVTGNPWIELKEGVEEDKTEAGRDSMVAAQLSLASWR